MSQHAQRRIEAFGPRQPDYDMAMKHVAYHKATILSVTRDGLEYLDDQGVACTIDFHTCHENVQREVSRPGWMQVGQSPDIYVGFRDFSTKPLQITLAGDPETRFQFADYRAFHDFQKRLIEAGVTTIDMA
jgi:hypothetical protein